MTIDNIIFGNPSDKDFKLLQVENYLDKLLPEFKKYPPPPNSSEATRAELMALADYVKAPRNQKNNLYDEALIHHILNVFTNAGADPQEVRKIMSDIADDVLPLITKLKYFFQRPRPATLSYYHNIPMYPDFSYFTNSPSYPSCHTGLTVITCEVLGNRYPQSYSTVKKITTEVLYSRMHLGVHYSSDNDMAMLVGQRVVANPEFKLRYKL